MVVVTNRESQSAFVTDELYFNLNLNLNLHGIVDLNVGREGVGGAYAAPTDAVRRRHQRPNRHPE